MQDQATGSAVSYLYDLDGNVTTRSSTAGDVEGFGYDAANRMTSYSYWDFSGGTGSATYTYDDSGARASRVATKSLPAQTTITANTITVDDDYEIDLARGKARRHVFIDGQRALTLETPSLAVTPVQEFHIHRDHLGTSRLITNESGAVVQRAFNDPFGAMYKLVDGAGNDLAPSNRVSQYLFTGHHADIETGLDYFGARYYDPLVGQFLSLDPKLGRAVPGGTFDGLQRQSQCLNGYAYAENRPTRMVDPDGKQSYEAYTAGIGQGVPWGSPDNPEGSLLLLGGAAALYAAPLLPEAAGTSYTWLLAHPELGIALGGDLMYGLMGGQGPSPVPLALGPVGEQAGRLVENATATAVSNSIPSRLARVIPGDIKPTMLGRVGAKDVFITAADDIAGLNSARLAERLGIPESRTFTVIEFDTPVSGLASPVFRTDPGFVGRGLTSGGAREFTLENGPIPPDASIRTVGE